MSEQAQQAQQANCEIRLERENNTVRILEKELEELNARLLRAEHGKSYFISHALNELNNPLAAIIGLTEQLMSMHQPSWEQVRESLQWVRDEGVYLEFQLKNLFMAGELEAGVAQVNRVQVDVVSVLNNVTTHYLGIAQRKGVAIHSNGGHALLPTAGGSRHFATDSAMLGLIYANLLDNAVKFSPPGAGVRVYFDVNEAGLDISVEDDGPGITQDDRPHVFDRFWQSDDSTTKLYRGLGLGLSVTAGCVELLGGHINLADATTRGARFSLHLPTLADGQFVDAPEDNVFFFEAGADAGEGEESF